MEFSTPKAIHQIKINNYKHISVEGKKCCPLEAMAVAFNYHRIDIKETQSSLDIKGLIPVTNKIKRFG